MGTKGVPDHMRASEKLVLGFLAYAALASLAFALTNTQRLVLWLTNAAATVAILLLSRLMAGRGRPGVEATEAQGSARWRAAFGALRDWLPCLLILLAYRESATFSLPEPSHPLNGIFERWDVALLGNAWLAAARAALSPWLAWYLEFAYLLCYPVVPLGFAVVYFLAARPEAAPGARARALDGFWTGVLLALFSCYVLYPFFPLTTPRLLFHDSLFPDSHSPLRRLNLWLLGQFAGTGGVFPSGHVAGATAIALSIWPHSRRWGGLFIVVAASIGVATVMNRYHYVADALAGMLIAGTAVVISRRIHPCDV